MVKSLAGYEAVLSTHKPLIILVEGHLTVAWNWTSSFLKSPEWETAFLPFPRKGIVGKDAPIHVVSSPA
jgi:hypothetical protein